MVNNNKVDSIVDLNISYEKTLEILSWKRCKQCIDMFYNFCD